MMTKFRVNRLRRRLLNLHKNGGINPYAVAFLLTESSFRGTFFRICELIYSAGVVFIGRVDPKITLGHCQVSFPYWRHQFGKKNLSLLASTLSFSHSYSICCAYLAANQNSSVRQMLVAYNGRPSKLYVQRFEQNLRFVRSNLKALRMNAADSLATPSPSQTSGKPPAARCPSAPRPPLSGA